MLPHVILKLFSVDHLLASKLSYVKNEATYFVITDVFLTPRLTIGLGFLVNDPLSSAFDWILTEDGSQPARQIF